MNLMMNLIGCIHLFALGVEEPDSRHRRGLLSHVLSGHSRVRRSHTKSRVQQTLTKETGRKAKYRCGTLTRSAVARRVRHERESEGGASTRKEPSQKVHRRDCGISVGCERMIEVLMLLWSS